MELLDTREGRIINEYIIGSIEVTSIVDKLRENRLRLLGHVLRREMDEAVKIVINMNVEGNRERKRHKKRWFEVVEIDMEMAGVCEKDARDQMEVEVQGDRPQIVGRKSEGEERDIHKPTRIQT